MSLDIYFISWFAEYNILYLINMIIVIDDERYKIALNSMIEKYLPRIVKFVKLTRTKNVHP